MEASSKQTKMLNVNIINSRPWNGSNK